MSDGNNIKIIIGRNEKKQTLKDLDRRIVIVCIGLIYDLKLLIYFIFQNASKLRPNKTRLWEAGTKLEDAEIEIASVS